MSTPVNRRRHSDDGFLASLMQRGSLIISSVEQSTMQASLVSHGPLARFERRCWRGMKDSLVRMTRMRLSEEPLEDDDCCCEEGPDVELAIV